MIQGVFIQNKESAWHPTALCWLANAKCLFDNATRTLIQYHGDKYLTEYECQFRNQRIEATQPAYNLANTTTPSD